MLQVFGIELSQTEHEHAYNALSDDKYKFVVSMQGDLTDENDQDLLAYLGVNVMLSVNTNFPFDVMMALVRDGCYA